MTTLEEIIGPYFNDLSENEKQTYRALLKYRREIPNLSLTEMAALIYTSKSSLLRFIQKLGLKGVSDFKYSLDWTAAHSEIKEEDSDLGLAVQTIDSALTPKLLMAFKDLLNASSPIYLCASSESQYILMELFSYLLLKKGYPSSRIRMSSASELAEVVFSNLSGDALVVFFSSNAKSSTVCSTLSKLKAQRISTILITKHFSSWLEKEVKLLVAMNFSRQFPDTDSLRLGLSSLFINRLIEKALTKDEQ